MAIYYVTKAYVLSFTEALAEELANTSIKVSCLAPGPTKIHFGAIAGMETSRLFKLGLMDVHTVAQAGYDGLRQGKVLVIPGLKNKIGALAVWFTPRGVIRKLVKGLNT
jgi:short-subunit dehydrogenase